jgi:hypothetical protein
MGRQRAPPDAPGFRSPSRCLARPAMTSKTSRSSALKSSGLPVSLTVAVGTSARVGPDFARPRCAGEPHPIPRQRSRWCWPPHAVAVAVIVVQARADLLSIMPERAMAISGSCPSRWPLSSNESRQPSDTYAEVDAPRSAVAGALSSLPAGSMLIGWVDNHVAAIASTSSFQAGSRSWQQMTVEAGRWSTRYFMRSWTLGSSYSGEAR